MGCSVAEVGGIGVNQGLNVDPHFLVSLDRSIGPHQAVPVLLWHQQHRCGAIHSERLGAGFEQQGQGELVEG